MRADILIVGQGIAGTMLGWEFERAGISFAITDLATPQSASRAAAGLINPITGRRLVPSWRIDTMLPLARRAYAEFESALGVRTWHDVRIRRLFADERERAVFAEKTVRGEWGEWAGAGDAEGFWIEGAARVDVGLLLTAARSRWTEQGRWREADAHLPSNRARYDLIIDCTGLHAARSGGFAFVPWEFSKGEVLELQVAGLDPDVVLNRRHWIAPVGPGLAWVGATHEPGKCDFAPSPEARAALTMTASELLTQPFKVIGQRAGVRVNVQDKRPVIGRHPDDAGRGLINGLGGKGVLLAPYLARQWVNHLTEGVPFDADVDLARFSLRHSSQASAR